MHEYTFDLNLEGSITIKAETEDEAQDLLAGIESFDANLGAFPNGDPILCELHRLSKADKLRTIVPTLTIQDLHEMIDYFSYQEAIGIVLVHTLMPVGDSAQGGLKVAVPSTDQVTLLHCLVHILKGVLLPGLAKRIQELEVGNVENN